MSQQTKQKTPDSGSGDDIVSFFGKLFLFGIATLGALYGIMEWRTGPQPLPMAIADR